MDTTTTTDDVREAYAGLSSALNALAGCVMFAPAHLKVKDGPALAEKAQQAAFDFEHVLDGFLTDAE